VLAAVGLRRADRAVLLALLHLAGGVMLLGGALAPQRPETPVPLIAVVACLGLASGTVLLVLRRRVRAWGIHLAVAEMSAVIALLAHVSVTPGGIVGLGPALVCVGMYAAHVMPPRQARAHLWPALAAATVGAAASGVDGGGLRNGWVVAVVTAFFVCEAQLRLVQRLRHGAEVDALTGLANRARFLQTLGQQLGRARQRGPVSVALFDLDGFKQVNDTFGHHAGDVLLQEVAEAWREAVRPCDLLARYGGDEFALLLPGVDEDVARAVVRRLQSAHPAGSSGGAATWRPGESVTELLHRADVALYADKRARRDARPTSQGVAEPAVLS